MDRKTDTQTHETKIDKEIETETERRKHTEGSPAEAKDRDGEGVRETDRLGAPRTPAPSS